MNHDVATGINPASLRLANLIGSWITYLQSAVKGAVRISPDDFVQTLRHSVVTGLYLWAYSTSAQRHPVSLEHLALSIQRESMGMFLNDDSICETVNGSVLRRVPKRKGYHRGARHRSYHT